MQYVQYRKVDAKRSRQRVPTVKMGDQKRSAFCPLVSDLPKIVITAFTFIFWLHCVIAACDSDLLEELIQMKLITASHLECLVVECGTTLSDLSSGALPAQSDGQWHSVTFLPIVAAIVQNLATRGFQRSRRRIRDSMAHLDQLLDQSHPWRHELLLLENFPYKKGDPSLPPLDG